MTHSNWNCPQCHNPGISGDLIQCPRCGKKRNRWGYWDCRYCGSAQIRADHKECPNCGKPKDRDVKFYLHDDSHVEFVDEVSGEAAVRIGHQNWICSYCSQQNDDSVQICSYCGAQRAESQERYHDIPAPASHPKPDSAAAPMLAKRRKHNSTGVCCLVIALFFLVPVFFGYFIEILIYRSVKEVPVESAYWESSIYVEALKTFQDSGWELPDNARLLRTEMEDYQYVHHYEERSRSVWVDDGYDYDYNYDNNDCGWDDYGWNDYGDGQFGMLLPPVLTVVPQCAAFGWEIEYYEEPVYATRKEKKYYYEYDAWTDERTVRQTGQGNTPPSYGELTLRENERERDRSIRYYVTFCYKGSTEKTECSEAEYYQFVRDGVVRFRIRDALTAPQKEFVTEQ